MVKFLWASVLVGLAIILIWFLFFDSEPLSPKQNVNTSKEKMEITLPQPDKTSAVSIEEALLERRSLRNYKDEALTLKEVSQILWSAQGITDSQSGKRAVPSAGALYPLEVYLVVRKAEELEPGVYHYLPNEHKLKRILENDVSADLAQIALGQMFVAEAPVNIVFSGIFERTTKKYGERGERYVHMEAGHASQNVYLQVYGLGLGTVAVGAFDDEELRKLLNLEKEQTPLYIMPIGRVGS